MTTSELEARIQPQNQSKHVMFAQIANKKNPLKVECGQILEEITVAYEIFGKINEEKNNVILICHAFSGDSHVGTYPDEPELPGWWDKFVGPNKAFDTNKYAILCSNVLGGCMGTTGPGSIPPNDNKPYGLRFPVITIGDMVEVQYRLVKKLGIEKLLSVVGGSMGGMQVLQWCVSHPEMIKSAIPIATTSRLSPQGIAFNEVGRRAIINDPKWNNGDYTAHSLPEQGLALARMIAHITYLSDDSMRQKFGRDLRASENYKYVFDTEFEVESYLQYQGNKFIKRFDANTYLYLSKAVDYFDLEKTYGSLENAFNNVQARFLIMTFQSDWLYPPYQGREIVSALQHLGKQVTYIESNSKYGHDAFLLEVELMEPIISGFLNKTYTDN